jgi:hypothetical protein
MKAVQDARFGNPVSMALDVAHKILGRCRAKQGPQQAERNRRTIERLRERITRRSTDRQSQPADAPDRGKFVGKKVGKAEHVLADKTEQEIAQATGGKWMSDYEPHDVEIRAAGGRKHLIEVKSLSKGKKQKISVHDDALARKVDRLAQEKPGSIYHTVAVDHRRTHDGGANAEHYSGHQLYYRRASGPYTLSSMYKVKNYAELKRLIRMPDHELPPKARGEFPSGEKLEHLREQAKKAHASRLRKDRALKARKKAERQGGS